MLVSHWLLAAATERNRFLKIDFLLHLFGMPNCSFHAIKFDLTSDRDRIIDQI